MKRLYNWKKKAIFAERSEFVGNEERRPLQYTAGEGGSNERNELVFSRPEKKYESSGDRRRFFDAEE